MEQSFRHPVEKPTGSATDTRRVALSVKVFVDTNVFVYGRDSSDPDKHEQAVAWLDYLWSTQSGCLSVQVLNEYYVTVTRKLTPGLEPASARADVNDLMAWSPIPVDEALMMHAIELEDGVGASFWDALIIAAALRSDAELLLTEDLSDGQAIGPLTITNPFSVPPPV